MAFDWGEITTAVNYVATPIRQAGKITYAISISIPAYRFDSKNSRRSSHCLMQATPSWNAPSIKCCD
ncbi:MAG: IclR family transcriptional regulator C-terminal domain-containing protein [Olegusella sp.]|nr:IclR family transcriptional regulator C-terminal domain-containing protein [Olegusella sp.]